MIDYPACIQYLHPNVAFSMVGDEITAWVSELPRPTQAELDAAWPLVQAKWASDAQAEQVANTNENTIGQQLEAALNSNLGDVAANNAGIADNDAWLAANTGSSLSAAVLTARLKKTVQQNTAAARQRNAIYKQLNGLIRMKLRKLETADTLKAPPTI